MLPYLPKPLTKNYQGEPNVVAGVHRGYSWAIIRTEALHLCGYVQVPEGHPLYLRPYGNFEVSVHGGLTFSCEAEAPFSGYWIGFDCAHGGDLSPKISNSGTYRTVLYVRDECERLIDQLIDYKPTAKFRLRQELLAVVERFKNEKEYLEWKAAITSLLLSL
jgi:hypothetical protein